MALAFDAGTFDRIQKRQQEIRPVRTLLMLLASVFFGIFWLAFHVWAFAWSVLSFAIAAGVDGWNTAKESRSVGAG